MNSMIDEGHVHNVRQPMTIGEPERKRIESILIGVIDRNPGEFEAVNDLRLILDPVTDDEKGGE